MIGTNIPEYSIFGDNSTVKFIAVVNSKAFNRTNDVRKRKRCEYKGFRAYKSANRHYDLNNERIGFQLVVGY